ncbi:MAG: hypothetical protein IT434_16085 [Phycisphaerales bacterium]|nr:hypothetical protein [Phycisphaerales bacterium]
MKRAEFAALLVGIGLVLVGVALGLIWMDHRQRDVVWMQLNAAEGRSDLESIGQGLAARRDESRARNALVSGSLGAGLTGAGVVLIVARMRIFNPLS